MEINYDGSIFSSQVRAALEERGGSISKFESELGLAKGAFYKFDSSAPGADTLLKISHYFDKSIDWFLKGGDAPTCVENFPHSRDLCAILLEQTQAGQLIWETAAAASPIFDAVSDVSDRNSFLYAAFDEGFVLLSVPHYGGEIALWTLADATLCPSKN